MAKKTIQLKDLLALIGMYDNVKIYSKYLLRYFLSMTNIHLYDF